LAPSAEVVGIPRRGAGGLAARGALVKKLFDRNGKKPLRRAFQSENSVVIDCPPWMRRIASPSSGAMLTAWTLSPLACGTESVVMN
jgi:hypothetical protein